MGTVASSSFVYLKQFLNRYNAQNRAIEYIKLNKLPASPRHKLKNAEAIKSNKKIDDLHKKDEQLNEILRKVYLTSTDEEKKICSTRPLPVKREPINKHLMFYEPPIPKPNFCTVSTITKILLYHQNNPNSNVSDVAVQYNLEKESVFKLMMYYSLFTKEEFEFMNKDKLEPEREKIDFKVYTRLEKQPLKQIEGKK